MSESRQEIEVLVWPEAARWPRGAAKDAAFTPNENTRRFRQQLGLPTDRPVIMSGHQAVLWHPGILAKWLAVRAWAEAHCWAGAWVVVDHDPEDFTVLRVPARDERAGGRLVATPVAIGPRELGERARTGGAPCELPPFEPPPVHVPDGLMPLADVEPARRALAEARVTARSAAEQLTRATSVLIGGDAPAFVFASRLGATDYFASLVARMAREAERCHAAYNRSLAAAPHAGLVPLGLDARRGFELPLWMIDPATGARRRVWSADLAVGGGIPSARLAPRALMLTAVLRSGACDAFVHGLGGGASRVDGVEDRYVGYDRATEAWVGEWLGITLAPSVVVSATMRLPLMDGSPVTAPEVAQAWWAAHAARHTPAMVGDESGARRKALALKEINEMPRGTPARRDAYLRMHAELLAASERRAPAMAALREQASTLSRRMSDQAVALDRTWSIALFGKSALGELDRRVREAVR